MKKMYDGTYIEWEVDRQSGSWKEKMQKIAYGIEQFKAYYDNHDIPAAVLRDKGVPIDEVVYESRYADLLVVDAGYSPGKDAARTPTTFIEELLTKAECPVIIAPDDFKGVEEIVFAWDGSASATFAIKQFTYLLPELREKKVSIIQVREDERDRGAAKQRLSEWLSNYYTHVGWDELDGPVNAVLLEYCLGKKGAFVVFGAYGRSMMSRFFQRSRAEQVIRTVAQPFFIAHHS
ncbi:universal stress protein [Paraflavitalea sp. CAU 1676]|uniref:universal stress protein n=1 Tax=Paraflavitalea sp. CAU 1676 TaxID=3032598 RepID=UPI0023DC52C3|nr:universal stress protein [Paraflavitalea sp. CAU 1676]MDF2193195.1 universal stress protein [Paraflavitalea sp. CAU 1676]